MMSIIEKIIEQQGENSKTVQVMQQFFPVIEKAEAAQQSQVRRDVLIDAILSDEQITEQFEWYVDDPEHTNTFMDFARGIEQAVLHSSEIQALRKDAERYHKLVADWFDNVHGREFELMNDMPPDAYQSKADIDEAIDKTMEKKK